MLFYLLNLPECHPFLAAVLFGVFANEGTFKETLEAEEKIGLILDGGDDDDIQSGTVSGSGIGKKLVAEKGGFFCRAACY